VRITFFLIAALAAAGCDRDTGPSGGIVSSECTPMPAECPATLACEVSTVVEDGEDVRVCGGASCCQSFCELNGCGRCCGPAAAKVTEPGAAR
jgi:hypothetical protein